MSTKKGSSLPTKDVTSNTTGNSGLLPLVVPPTTQISQQTFGSSSDLFHTSSQVTPTVTEPTYVKTERVFPERTKELVLLNEQVEHYNMLLFILKYSFFCINRSDPGTGKTFISCKTALDHELPVVVIGPASLRNTWEMVTSAYGVPYIAIKDGKKNVPAFYISYDELRGKTSAANRQLASQYGSVYWPVARGLIRRTDTEVADGDTEHLYTLEQPFIDIIREGALIVFDEVAHASNESAMAAEILSVIAEEVDEADSRSRIIMMSATIAQKTGQSMSYLKSLGFLNKNDRGRWDYGTFIMKMLALCPDGLGTYPITESDFNQETADLAFLQIFLKVYSHAMVAPVFDDLHNGYYSVSDEEEQRLQVLVLQLEKEIEDIETQRARGIGATKGVLNVLKIKAIMQKIEYQKMPLLIRLIIHTLSTVPGSKVIVVLNYVTKSIDELPSQGVEALKDIEKWLVSKFKRSDIALTGKAWVEPNLSDGARYFLNPLNADDPLWDMRIREFIDSVKTVPGSEGFKADMIVPTQPDARGVDNILESLLLARDPSADEMLMKIRNGIGGKPLKGVYFTIWTYNDAVKYFMYPSGNMNDNKWLPKLMDLVARLRSKEIGIPKTWIVRTPEGEDQTSPTDMLLYYLNNKMITEMISTLARTKQVLIDSGADPKKVEELGLDRAMEFSGTVTQDERVDIQRQFQANDNSRRILIITGATGGEGISFHDTHGGHPRYLFVMPTYDASLMTQVAGRINRAAMKSVPHGRIVYANLRKPGTQEELKEGQILDSLIKKSIYLDFVNAEQAESGTKYPGSYTDEYIDMNSLIRTVIDDINNN